MKTAFTILAVLAFAHLAIYDQKNSWLKTLQKIIPLASTEKEVNAILGQPQKRYSDIGEYKINEGEIFVIYSEGKCKNDSASEFDVEKGTVISFGFTPKKVIKFSSLKLNLKKLKRQESSDVTDSLVYYDLQNGVLYDVYDDEIKYISFSGAKDSPAKPCSEVFKSN